MKESKYIILCTKAIAGEINPEEETQLTAWLEESSSNRERFDSMRQTWRSMERDPVELEVDVDAEWVKIQKRLSIASRKSVNHRLRPGFHRFREKLSRPSYRFAFAGIACILITLATVTLWKKNPILPGVVEVVTENGETKEITLADGSVVKLNCSSTVTYPKSFSTRIRQVNLDGEAYFDIVPGEIPFVILTENAKTTVLGTEFNVRARNKETTVIVREGSVRLGLSQNDEEHIVLAEGEMGRIHENTPPLLPQSVDVNRMLGWLDGKIVFVRTSFGQILEELERIYDVSIVLESSHLQERTVTASYDQVPLNTVLTSLCLTVNAEFSGDKQIITVRSAIEEPKR